MATRTWSTCLRNLCNNNRHICGVIIERVGACIQSFNANCNIQWFRCMLDRLWGAIGVFEVLIYCVVVASRIFNRWGDWWIIRQILSWLCFKEGLFCNNLVYAIAVALVSNLQQLQMELARYCWFIINQCGRDNLHRNQIVVWKMQCLCVIRWDETLHLLV